MLKIIGIVLLVIVAVVAALLIWISKKPAVVDDYISKVQTDGAIEEKYIKAFIGDYAELLNNTLYQDQEIHISE